MITNHSIVKIADNALIQRVSDEMVILDIETGQYYTLNEVAADILSLMQAGKNCGQVALCICDSYEVSEEKVNGDITDMLNELRDKKLVSIE